MLNNTKTRLANYTTLAVDPDAIHLAERRAIARRAADAHFKAMAQAERRAKMAPIVAQLQSVAFGLCVGFTSAVATLSTIL